MSRYETPLTAGRLMGKAAEYVLSLASAGVATARMGHELERQSRTAAAILGDHTFADSRRAGQTVELVRGTMRALGFDDDATERVLQRASELSITGGTFSSIATSIVQTLSTGVDLDVALGLLPYQR